MANEWSKTQNKANQEKYRKRVEERRKYYENNKEEIKAKARLKYWQDPVKNAAKEAKKRRDKQKENPAKYIHSHVKSRVKSRGGIPFDIEWQDVVIPEVCPVLGIPIQFGDQKCRANSPSLDRIDNSKGYTKDNIWVISHRANTMKGDSSFEELRRFCTNMLKKLDEWEAGDTGHCSVKIDKHKSKVLG